MRLQKTNSPTSPIAKVRGSSPPQSERVWLATWAASPAPPLASGPGIPEQSLARSFKDQTVDQVMRLSAGGEGLRIRFTNEYGTTPLQIGAAYLALVNQDGTVIADAGRALEFDGRVDAVIPPGSPWFSDPVDLTVPARARLLISLYFPNETGLCTCHAIGGQTAIVSPPGNYTGKSYRPVETFAARAFVSQIEVSAAAPIPVVVAFGDSITDGYPSDMDKDCRWTDRLAERCIDGGGVASYSVANAGLSGNRLVADGLLPPFGQSAIARFDRDALSISGVSTVILLEGINDIILSRDRPVTEQELISGYRQLIERAHAKGVRIIGGTLLPYAGADHFRPEGEVVRKAVNEWILSSMEFDNTIDFDRAMRNPLQPSRMRADLHSGDWVHPNAAGYRVMGDTVSLSDLG